MGMSAELSVIGAMLQSETAIKKAQALTAGDFENTGLSKAFDAIQALYLDKRKADLVTAGQKLPGLEALLVDAVQACPSPIIVDSHIEVVKEQSIRRQAQAIASRLYNSMQDQSLDSSAAISEARQSLSDLGTARNVQWLSSADIANSTLRWLEQPRDKGIVSSGVPDIDRLIGGFFPGEMTVVGARPGTGKTVFGMLIAMAAAKKGQRAGVVNLEMLESQYGQRLISYIGGIDGMKMRKREIDDLWPQIVQAAGELSKMVTDYQFTARYIEDLIPAVMDSDIEILVIDYLQLLRTRKNIDQERLIVGHISWQLKQLAVNKRIPIVVLSQLRRPEQDNKMPTMRDLRESGNIEADADGIILLHEPIDKKDPYVHKIDKEFYDGWKEQGYRYIAMKVEKQRNGALGTVAVLFEPSKMRYSTIDRGTP